ncbi:MAG: hypothetical protein JW782_04710 [Candidatus Saganbacteria bacterium]|nr:hypothetical protein [Candidatus Saganbacteria bacterium]
MKNRSLIIFLLLLMAGVALAKEAEFKYVPAQEHTHWQPPGTFGQAPQTWSPPPEFKWTARPWSPPEGFEGQYEPWAPPSGWGEPEKWRPAPEFM